jgi:hypothetical protein
MDNKLKIKTQSTATINEKASALLFGSAVL